MTSLSCTSVPTRWSATERAELREIPRSCEGPPSSSASDTINVPLIFWQVFKGTRITQFPAGGRRGGRYLLDLGLRCSIGDPEVGRVPGNKSVALHGGAAAG